MNKFWSFLCLALIFWATLLPCEDEDFISCEKTYVDPDQLIVSGSCIFVALNSKLLEIAAIFMDQEGLYFTDYKQKKCDKGQWQCRICDHCNPNYKIWCEVCSN